MYRTQWRCNHCTWGTDSGSMMGLCCFINYQNWFILDKDIYIRHLNLQMAFYFKQCQTKRGVLTKTNLDSCDVCISQGAQQQINNYLLYDWAYIQFPNMLSPVPVFYMIRYIYIHVVLCIYIYVHIYIYVQLYIYIFIYIYVIVKHKMIDHTIMLV